MNRNNKTTVAWISRHAPVPAQIAELEEKLGDITIVQVTDTYTNYHNIIETVRTSNARYGVLVIPLSMMQLILKAETPDITWLRAEMRPAHYGTCDMKPYGTECNLFDPETDVLMPITGNTGTRKSNRHIRFLEFVVLKSVNIETEPFKAVVS